MWEKPNSNLKQPLFFEVINECKHFSVLSVVHLVDFSSGSVSFPIPVPFSNSISIPIGTKTHVEYLEVIYLLGDEGKLEPYLKIMSHETDGVFLNNSWSSRKMNDKDLLEKYTIPFYDSLLAYASENKLHFKRKNDLVTILNYYSKISDK